MEESKNIDIIGLCHYRRYFKFSGGTDSIYLQKEISIQDVDTKSISTILDKYDVILPKPTIDRASVYDNFSRFMTEEQLQIYLRIFLSKHPEYESVLTNYMQNNKCVHFNMFIMRWDLFCQYNEFLFEILFEAKKVIKDFPYSFYNRSVGMFSEILLPIFCEFNKLKIKHLPIIFFCEENNQQKFYSKILPKWIKLKIKSIVNNFIFIVNRKKTDSIINHFWDMYLKNDGINIS